MDIKTIRETTRAYIAEAAGAARAKFREAVRPIYGATDRGTPDHIGTGLLLEIPEGHFLLTAAHVIDHAAQTSLYLGADDLALLQFEALASVAPDGNREKDHVDFAIAPIAPGLLTRLSGAKFITEADVSQSAAPTEGRTYTCLGYPNSKNKHKLATRTPVAPKLLTYTSTGKPASRLSEIAKEGLHILVDYNASPDYAPT